MFVVKRSQMIEKENQPKIKRRLGFAGLCNAQYGGALCRRKCTFFSVSQARDVPETAAQSLDRVDSPHAIEATGVATSDLPVPVTNPCNELAVKETRCNPGEGAPLLMASTDSSADPAPAASSANTRPPCSGQEMPATSTEPLNNGSFAPLPAAPVGNGGPVSLPPSSTVNSVDSDDDIEFVEEKKRPLNLRDIYANIRKRFTPRPDIEVLSHGYDSRRVERPPPRGRRAPETASARKVPVTKYWYSGR